MYKDIKEGTSSRDDTREYYEMVRVILIERIYPPTISRGSYSRSKTTRRKSR